MIRILFRDAMAWMSALDEDNHPPPRDWLKTSGGKKKATKKKGGKAK